MTDTPLSQRDINLTIANDYDDGVWVKHTDFHWSRMLKNHKLDYWPSVNKFQYRGKIRHTNVYLFINKFTK